METMSGDDACSLPSVKRGATLARWLCRGEMAAITLSRRELGRMIMSVEPEKETVADAKRNALKKLSDDRVKHWPNTLQATRDKKESFKVDRLAMVRSSRAPPPAPRARFARSRAALRAPWRPR
jgi:hypothetical protein